MTFAAVYPHCLNLQKLGFIDQVPDSDKRPCYHPADLLKLYIYGNLNRIRTSRLLERECKRNIELIWLLKGLQRPGDKFLKLQRAKKTPE